MEGLTQKIIPVAEIAREFPYACRYLLQDEKLAGSVAKRGILQPLWVAKQTKGFCLVSGHRRFQAALDSSLKTVPAFLLEKKYEPADLYLVSLLSNWNQNFSDLDKVYAISRAVSVFKLPPDVVLDEVLPALGLPSEKHYIDESLEIASLHPSVLDLVSRGDIPLRGIKTLISFSTEDQKVFVESIGSQISLSTNQLMNLVHWILDLMKSSGSNLRSFLEAHAGQFAPSLNASSQDKRQKSDKFYQTVRALRFPRLVDQERKFDKSTHEICGNFNALSFEAPSQFEGEGFVLRARLQSPESLDEVLKILEQKRSSLKSLFDIIL